ncbi:MAG TPA: zf-TFIIB domain-containing protein [Burkholderiales bacterium]|nr:zf-TFIIB domain-containing protein [Burkholderiales bacterium]
MKCPICTEVNLVMSDRQGIEIDYCPQCRGVWLDRGELDKIIERTATLSGPTAKQEAIPAESSQRPRYPEQRQGSDDDYRGDYRHKKRRGFLGDLFDFD